MFVYAHGDSAGDSGFQVDSVHASMRTSIVIEGFFVHFGSFSKRVYLSHAIATAIDMTCFMEIQKLLTVADFILLNLRCCVTLPFSSGYRRWLIYMELEILNVKRQDVL